MLTERINNNHPVMPSETSRSEIVQLVPVLVTDCFVTGSRLRMT